MLLAFLLDSLIAILSAAGVCLTFQSQGWGMFRYYTLCSNLILLLASRLCGVPLHRARYALGALLGALAALLGLITGAPGLISPQGRLLTALAICACAWGRS